MTGQRSSNLPPPAPLAWSLWGLLAATTLPVCQAEEAWLMAKEVWLLAAFVLPVSALGVWLSLRRGGAVVQQDTLAGLAVGLAFLVAMVWLQTGLAGVYVVANWLIAFGAAQCWHLAGSRDCGRLLVVSMLLLFVGSLVSGQILYAVALLVVILLGPFVLIGWHLLKERELRHALAQTGSVGAEGGRWPGRVGPLRGLCGSASLFCLAVGLVVFVAFPRMRTPLRPNIQGAARRVTGFSAQTRLGQLGEMQRSDRVAMRVRLTVAGQPIGSDVTQPYFRAATYSLYDGYGWRNPRKMGLVTIELPDDASFKFYKDIKWAGLPGAVEQEYWIPSGSPRFLFALQVPIAVGSQEIESLAYRPADDVLLTIPGSTPYAAHYKVLSVPSAMLPARRLRGETPAAAKLRRFWQEMKRGLYERGGLGGMAKAGGAQPEERRPVAPQIRPPQVSPRVWDLAETLAREAGDPRDPAAHEAIVGRFMRYLTSGGFTYTLRGGGLRRGQRVLEEFLFDTKRGHCEYFATALAVLCQCVGIPARYVTGYHGGKYNDVGRFYAVRDSDAHSWVEVYLPEEGWKRYDPTPPAPVPRSRSLLQSRLASLIDYLQFQWGSWVVAYDVLHRRALLGSFGNWLEPPGFAHQRPWAKILWMSRQLLLGPESLSLLGRVLYWLGMVSVVALSGYLVVQLTRQVGRWWSLRRQTRAARRAGVPFYQRLVSTLARQGLMRQAHETPREFALRVERTYPQIEGLFVGLIDRYYAVRFGEYAEPESAEPASRELVRRIESLPNAARLRVHDEPATAN